MNTTWSKGINKPAYPGLKDDILTDVVIVGGGITGLLSAYELARRGKKVAILEAATLGSNATLRTTAFLMQDIDTSLTDLTSMFGARKAKEVWRSHGTAINAIEKIIAREKIDCEFMRCDAVMFANSKKQFKDIKENYISAKRMGFPVALNARTLAFPSYGHMVVRNQAKFHAGKFLAGLAKKVTAMGVQIFEHAEVISLTDECVVVATTSAGSVTAFDAIIATYDPFGNPKATHFKKGMYVSYVLEARIPHDVIPEGLYLDGGNPYYYFRVDTGEGKYDRIIMGGEDHRREIPVSEEKAFASLEDHLKTMLGKKPYKILRTWTGPILEPSDGLALIGRLTPHHYVATAFSGNGMTYSMIAGMLLSDLIVGKKNAWKSLYDPTRPLTIKRIVKKGADYISEFAGGALKLAFRPANKRK